MRDQNDYNVRAVERAIQILDAFDDEHPQRGVSEIAEAVGLHKATTYRILTTLVNYGLVERSPDEQKYRLGIKLVDLGFKVTRRMDLRREALPYMTQLAQQIDEAVDLSIFDNNEVLYVEMIQSHHALTIAAMVGQRLPVRATAAGKVFLASLPESQLNELLQKPLTAYTKNTITDPRQLREQLQSIRDQGYALDNEEFEPGVKALAAPVCNRGGRVVAAISTPTPASRLTEDRVPEIAKALKEAAGEVSYRLGCRR